MGFELLKAITTVEMSLPPSAKRALDKNGMTLGKAELAAIESRKCAALKRLGRFEIEPSTVGSVVECFADSPFVNRIDCADTFGEVVELFIELRDAVPTHVGDEELLQPLRERFDFAEGDIPAICVDSLSSELTKGLLSPSDSNEYRIIDEDGREYVFNAADWAYDEQATGWDGEEWGDEF